MDDDIESKEPENGNHDDGSEKLSIAEDDATANLMIYILAPIACALLCIYVMFLFFNKRKQDTFVRYFCIDNSFVNFLFPIFFQQNKKSANYVSFLLFHLTFFFIIIFRNLK